MKTDGEKLKDKLEWVKFSSIAWKGEGFFYSRYDKPNEKAILSGKNENHKIYYHKIGNDQADDKLIYENPDKPLQNYTAITTDDENYLIISKTESTSGNSLMFKNLSTNEDFVELVKTFDYDFDVIGNIDNNTVCAYCTKQV